MIDSLMALCILTIGVLALLSMLPLGWTSTGATDNRSRAAQIMQAQLQNAESLMMNPCNAFPAPPFTSNRTIYASGNNAAIANAGDLPYTVSTTIAYSPVSASAWLVTTTVKWPSTSTGVSASLTVMQQEDYRYSSVVNPTNSCANGSVAIPQTAF